MTPDLGVAAPSQALRRQRHAAPHRIANQSHKVGIHRCGNYPSYAPPNAAVLPLISRPARLPSFSVPLVELDGLKPSSPSFPASRPSWHLFGSQPSWTVVQSGWSALRRFRFPRLLVPLSRYPIERQSLTACPQSRVYGQLNINQTGSEMKTRSNGRMQCACACIGQPAVHLAAACAGSRFKLASGPT